MNTKIKTIGIVLLCAFFGLVLYASDFERKVADLGGVFTLTNGFVAVTPKDNDAMKYDYAIRDAQNKYEVRYALRPIPKEMFEQYRNRVANHGTNGVGVDPNSNLYFKAEYLAIMFNISDSHSLNSFKQSAKEFNSEAVKAEFGADSGVTSFIPYMTPQFAQYKHCLMVGLHKTNLGQFYIFFLFNNPEDAKTMVADAFHFLKFKDQSK